MLGVRGRPPVVVSAVALVGLAIGPRILRRYFGARYSLPICMFMLHVYSLVPVTKTVLPWGVLRVSVTVNNLYRESRYRRHRQIITDLNLAQARVGSHRARSIAAFPLDRTATDNPSDAGPPEICVGSRLLELFSSPA